MELKEPLVLELEQEKEEVEMVDLVVVQGMVKALELEVVLVGVRDRENWASKKREIFGVLFRAPFFLGKWCGIATYFLYKK